MSSLEPFSFSKKDSKTESLKASENTLHRRVAAIDIGTNSTHLVVASIDPVLNTFSIDFAEKSTTRLGEKDPETGHLTETSMDRAFETLKRFVELAASYKVVIILLILLIS